MTCIATLKSGSAGVITVSFTDSDGSPALPVSVTYSVRCMTNELDIVVDENAGPASEVMNINISSSVNEIIDPINVREHRRVIVKANYGTDDDTVDMHDYYVKSVTL